MDTVSRVESLSKKIRIFAAVAIALSVCGAALGWILFSLGVPPTIPTAKLPLSLGRLVAGALVELMPFAAGLYCLFAIDNICRFCLKKEFFSVWMGIAHRRLGRGLIFLGIANIVYPTLVLIPLTYSGSLNITFYPPKSGDLCLVAVGITTVMLGYIFDEVHRISEDNAKIIWKTKMPIVVRLDVILAKQKVRSKELADFIGITEANLSLLKSGKVKGIRFSTLEAICRYLECEPGEILEFVAGESAFTDVCRPPRVRGKGREIDHAWG
jgi:putative transcriptional regulator